MHLAAEEPLLHLPRDLVFCHFPLMDGPANEPALLYLATTTVANFLEKHIPVLVCCGGGMSRSPAIAAAALALVYQENPDDCLKKVAEHQPGRAWRRDCGTTLRQRCLIMGTFDGKTGFTS